MQNSDMSDEELKKQAREDIDMIKSLLDASAECCRDFYKQKYADYISKTTGLEIAILSTAMGISICELLHRVFE